MKKSKWDERMSAMVPDEPVFYSVGLLQSAVQVQDFEYLENQNGQILHSDFAQINTRLPQLQINQPKINTRSFAYMSSLNEGRAIYASGSPFDPVEYDGKFLVPGQANNAYIFPGLGLGLVMSGAIRVHEDMLLAASEALASTNIREISANIVAKVAEKVYELGLASRLPRPENLVEYAKSCMYTPAYRSYRLINQKSASIFVVE